MKKTIKQQYPLHLRLKIRFDLKKTLRSFATLRLCEK